MTGTALKEPSGAAVCSVSLQSVQCHPSDKTLRNLLFFGIDLINNTLTVRISASRYIVMLAAAAAAAAAAATRVLVFCRKRRLVSISVFGHCT